MIRDEVINRLCRLVSHVGADHYNSELPHDCFCHEGRAATFQHVHPEIIAFIENAVNEKMARDKMR